MTHITPAYLNFHIVKQLYILSVDETLVHLQLTPIALHQLEFPTDCWYPSILQGKQRHSCEGKMSSFPCVDPTRLDPWSLDLDPSVRPLGHPFSNKLLKLAWYFTLVEFFKKCKVYWIQFYRVNGIWNLTYPRVSLLINETTH